MSQGLWAFGYDATVRRPPLRIQSLILRQYKSIERVDIGFAPLTVFVGRNGVGKSNLLDALRFIADGVRQSLEFAIRERGGIDHVRRKSLGGRPTNPFIGVEIVLPTGGVAHYSFRIAAVAGGGFRVDREDCQCFDASGRKTDGFTVKDGAASWSLPHNPPATVDDRLFLVAASGVPQFRPVFDVLARMTFHNLNPELMKFPQRPEAGTLLAHEGRNLASVVKRLEATPDRLERVAAYLRAIGVPVTRIQHKLAGPLETIEVAQEIQAPEGPRNSNFDAISLSDGTVRALGILVSLVSATEPGGGGPTLIGIEEPETALHPAAAGALMEALIDGAIRTQIVITSHSPDLLDHEAVTPEMIRPVLLDNGRTVAGVMSRAKADLLKQHLSTAGELLRLDQLQPDPNDIERQKAAKGTLFEANA